LGSAPDRRTRRALLHLSNSCASPHGPEMLVTHDPLRTQCPRSASVLHRERLNGSVHGALRNYLCKGLRDRMFGCPSRPVSFRSSFRANSFRRDARTIRRHELFTHNKPVIVGAKHRCSASKSASGDCFMPHRVARRSLAGSGLVSQSGAAMRCEPCPDCDTYWTSVFPKERTGCLRLSRQFVRPLRFPLKVRQNSSHKVGGIRSSR
jgi:hypothetical protein